KELPRLVETMGPDYPELTKSQSRIEELLQIEEESFFRTLRRGGNLLNQIIDSSKAKGGQISGDDAFKLKDTYGLPLDEIQLIGVDAGLKVDLERYHALEHEAKERSRKVHKTTAQVAGENLFEGFAKEKGASRFLGYQTLEAVGKVTALVVN